MASGKSLELAKLRRRPVMLTTQRRDPFAVIGPDHTYTADELEQSRRKVGRNDARRAVAAAKRWGR